MARKPKTLNEHVRTGTFRAREHAHLLESDRLPPQPPRTDLHDTWREMRLMASGYGHALDDQERRAVAIRFQRLAQQVPRRLCASQVSLRQLLHVTLGG